MLHRNFNNAVTICSLLWRLHTHRNLILVCRNPAAAMCFKLVSRVCMHCNAASIHKGHSQGTLQLMGIVSLAKRLSGKHLTSAVCCTWQCSSAAGTSTCVHALLQTYHQQPLCIAPQPPAHLQHSPSHLPCTGPACTWPLGLTAARTAKTMCSISSAHLLNPCLHDELVPIDH